MVIIVPATAVPGLNEVIVGVGIKLNPGNKTLPPGVITDTVPVVPDATVAVIDVGDTTVNVVAGVPPKLTVVVPVKFVPVKITTAPALAVVGVNEVMVGAWKNVNPASVAVPPAVVTETLPVVPAAITAVILVAEFTVNDVGAVLPNKTAVALVKPVPVIVIVLPGPDDVGVNEVIVGTGINVKPGKIDVPPSVVTETLPVAAVPIVAVI
jgi:hypothetical protein